ncbi:hypothetical protein GCM10011579_013710 [Streptomyces albiflavescens]|uniref:Terminal beta-(1->2)-arabinofuranosyltransferase C-terminal domain-containing protein n=1 Tax=Streptomyces albiflavescens TaxID=1623582 RepID=A0A917XVR5_9ACTN|nr:hypothetical protein GCM10011579_013710 [Streptomyces albiflavescens]
MVPALLVAFAGFQRRWMADDAYIYVRTVRQILAGNGPVFNAGERVESSTGTLWQWLLVAAGLPGADLATAAVYGGLLLTAVGFALAGIGALRLYGDRAGLPLGSLVLLALPPVWDFATSGLETGLATCWIAGAWLALSTRSASLMTSLLLGLGPLVRPDLGLVSAVFLAAQWLLVRPTRRGTLAGVASAAAFPGAYEIFRAGYYGHLVPLPAVTKEAGQSLWGRGFGYLGDFSGPYLLWVPALFVAAALLFSRRRWAWRVTAPHGGVPLVPALAPVVAGLLCWLYVIRVGGDFMHGRMLLPGLLLMLLPVFVVPVTRAGALAAVGVGVWAVVCAGWLRIPYGGQVGPAGISDERGVYALRNADAHPIHHTFAGAPWHVAHAREVREAERSGAPTLLWGDHLRMAADSPSVTASYAVLGWNGAVVPLNGAALDSIGLADPLAAHSERVGGGRAGHDKHLPATWLAADRGDPAVLPPGLDPARVTAARRALRCGALAELRSATRDPLTPGRFLRNVAGSWERTSFRFPDDPVEAERELCGER